MGSGEGDARYIDRMNKRMDVAKKSCNHAEASLHLGKGALCHKCGQWALWDKPETKRS